MQYFYIYAIINKKGLVMKRDLFKNTFIVAIGKFGTQVLSYFLLTINPSLAFKALGNIV